MPHPNLCFLFFMEPSSTWDLLDIFKFCFTSNTFSEHTQFEQKHGKRKTDGRSATDGTASQLFSASSSSHLWYIPSKNMYLHTGEIWAEFVLQVSSSSSSSNSSSLFTPAYWLYDSITPLSKSSPSLLPQRLEETGWQMFLNNNHVPRKSVLLQAFLQTIWKNWIHLFLCF